MRAASQYSTEQVYTLLGVVGLAIFVVCVIVFAAVVTATVVRISPTREKKPEQAGPG
jgi:hypothetical protein